MHPTSNREKPIFIMSDLQNQRMLDNSSINDRKHTNIIDGLQDIDDFRPMSSKNKSNTRKKSNQNTRYQQH